MKYNDGKEVLLGDRVSSYGQKGIVVIDCDSNAYSKDFPKNDWSDHLEIGVLIKFDNGALFHIDRLDPYEADELLLIERKSR